jgi:hypothetical protein
VKILTFFCSSRSFGLVLKLRGRASLFQEKGEDERFEGLIAWQKARTLTAEIYRVLRHEDLRARAEITFWRENSMVNRSRLA